MAHPLDGIRAKLDRADEHLEVLNAEIAAFLRGNPYAVVDKLNRKAKTYTLTLRIFREPPLRLGSIAGDCVHNLRSALDHLTVALGDQLGATPTDAEQKKIRFPTFSTRSAWNRGHWQHVKFLSAPMIAEVEALQPYHGWQHMGPFGHPLWKLERLWNWDKHNLLIPTIGVLEGLSDVVYEYEQNAIVETKWILPSTEHLQDRTDLGALKFSKLGRHAEVKMHGCITFDVSLGRGPAITEELGKLARFVRKEVMPRFEPFFPKGGARPTHLPALRLHGKR